MTTPHQPTGTARVPFWVFTLLPLILVTLLTIWACDSSDEDESSCDPAAAGCEESSSSSSDEESSSSSCDADSDCEVGYRCEYDGECVEGCLDATHCAAGEGCSPYEDCISCPDGYFYYDTSHWERHPEYNFCVKGSGQFCDASFGDDPSETGCPQGELCTTYMPYCVAGLSGAFVEQLHFEGGSNNRTYCLELMQSGVEVNEYNVTLCAPGAYNRFSAKNCWNHKETAVLESDGFGSYSLKIEFTYHDTNPDDLQEDGSLKILGEDTVSGTLDVDVAGHTLRGELYNQNCNGEIDGGCIDPFVEWQRTRGPSGEAMTCLDLNP